MTLPTANFPASFLTTLRPQSSLPRLHRTCLLVAAAWACSMGAAATAQTLPAQLPSGAEAGREIPRPVMPQSSTAVPRIEVPQSPSAQAPAGAQDLRFTLKTLTVEGATAFPADDLRQLYVGLLDREVSVAEVFAVANAIELKYRNAGYVTSRVIVPQQAIEDGRFRLVVVEGFVADVRYEDDIGPARAAVERLVGGLRGVKPISVAEIERRLLLANDLAGLTVRGTLEPSPNERGGSVLTVRTERKPTDGQVTLDNRASPYLGRGQLQVSHAWNAVGERADRITLNARTSVPTGRSIGIGAGYDALIGSNGTMLTLALSHARSNPRRELEPLDVKSRVTSGLGTVTVPVIRSRDENLRAFGQVEVRDVDTDLTGIEFTRDRLRIVRAGVSYDRSDLWDGITTVRATLHQGLHGLGASDNGSALASRANGRSDFTKLTFDLTRLQQIAPRLSAVGSFTSQFSRRPLLASEEIALGGASFGRAYDEGELSSDNGIAAMVELRYVPDVRANTLQLYGYIDGGRVWAAEGGNEVTPRKLTSFGGGVRAKLNDYFYASFEIAKPMNTIVRTEGNKDPRAFVSLTALF